MKAPITPEPLPSEPSADGTPSIRPPRVWMWAAIPFVVVAVLAGCLFLWTQSQQRALMAEVEESCRDAVTDWAKYPGGVSFPDEIEFTRRESEDEVWEAEGVVDFPNGWGTPIRQDYSCVIRVKDGEVWSPFAYVSES